MFFVDGFAETDGIHYTPARIGRRYSRGLLVVQNGDAPGPDDPSPINGYEFDGATQCVFIDPSDVFARLLR